MNMQQHIEQSIQQAFAPIYVSVNNESHMHAGPETESHYKLTLVTQAFEEVSRVKRHQMVYKALQDTMDQIHALALHTYTPSEWETLGRGVPDSPPCRSGG